jgi:hypothetical protein
MRRYYLDRDDMALVAMALRHQAALDRRVATAAPPVASADEVNLLWNRSENAELLARLFEQAEDVQAYRP